MSQRKRSSVSTESEIEKLLGLRRDWAVGLIGGVFAIIICEFILGRLTIKHASPSEDEEHGSKPVTEIVYVVQDNGMTRTLPARLVNRDAAMPWTVVREER